MRVLVTGANGLLGSNLVRSLLAKDYKVSAFLRVGSYAKTLQGLAIGKYYGDILDKESLENAISHNDIVIHAAAITDMWPSRLKAIRDVNINGTKNVVDAALKYKVKRMIYVGSASSFNTIASINSKMSFPGAKFGIDYIDSKYEALKLVLNAVNNEQLPALAILPTFMVGAYDYKPSSGKLILAAANNKIKYYTGGGKNFVHVSDVAAAIVNAIEMGTIGKYYIAGNENLSYESFFKKVSSIIEVQAPVKKIPDWAIKAIGLFGSMAGSSFRIKPFISYPMARISCENQFVSSTDAVNELMMPQTNIETAIKESYDWLKKHQTLLYVRS